MVALIQEASAWFCKIFHSQLPLELLPVVLLGWRCMRILTVPDIWPQGMETDVRLISSWFLLVNISIPFF